MRTILITATTSVALATGTAYAEGMKHQILRLVLLAQADNN
jgi:hypothetical protein